MGVWAEVYIQRVLIKLLDGGHMTKLLLQLQNLLCVWNIRYTLFVHSIIYGQYMYVHKAAIALLQAITQSFQNKYTLKWCPHTTLPDGG